MGEEVKGFSYSNAGILVENENERRLTVAADTWDEVDQKHVYHAGVYVGGLEDVLGTDVGLVSPVVSISNVFLEPSKIGVQVNFLHGTMCAMAMWW